MNTNIEDRIQKTQDMALESLDYILETISASGFVEIVGRMGGDTVTYRIYDNGDMYEG